MYAQVGIPLIPLSKSSTVCPFDVVRAPLHNIMYM
jgi:hypothetical protein